MSNAPSYLFEVLLLKGPKPSDNSAFYIGFRKLHAETFGEESTFRMEEELPTMRSCNLWIAHSCNEVLGFKLGYEMEIDEYYSWRGAVSKDHKRKGIGSALMIAQHDWCKEYGYKRIQTRTRNKWREMLILNLKHGFRITGTLLDEQERLKIILEKDL
jgi:GNAT superfamily N-acetyltransferase